MDRATNIQRYTFELVTPLVLKFNYMRKTMQSYQGLEHAHIYWPE